MIRNLLATTAIATLLASGAVAQTTAPTTDPAMSDPAAQQQDTQMVVRAEGHLASEIIGESVYNGTSEDAENIGDVTDLVVDQEGNIQAIVVGVGGFLGIGQKEVALEYNLVQWSEQQDGERWLVVETTRDALEAQQEFDRAAYRPMPADADVAETKPATAEDLAAAPAPEEGAEGTDDTAMAPADDQAGDTIAVAPADDQSGDTTAAAPADDQAGDTTAAAPADDQAGDTTAAAPTDDQSGDTMAAAPADDQAGDTTAAAPTDDQAGDTTAAAPADDQAGDMTAAAPTDDQAGEETTMAEDRQDRPSQDDTAMTTTNQDQAAGTDQTQTAAIDRNSLQQAQPDQIRAENLVGTTVYGSNEENIGEIGDVVLTPEGEVDAIIIDVGGFLGIGSKEVAVAIDNLAFMTDENGDLYLYTEFTQEELEAQPEYDEATYAEQRDEMRLQVQ